MSNQLRVGVIGLGKRWQRRYRPALRQLQDRFEVRALCDDVYQRAINEAYRLGCDAVAGPTQLLESTDIDAVLLLDPAWYGLWPLEAACRAGKPVFCCPTPDLDEAHADALVRRVQESGLTVMMELALRQAPATQRLRELLATRLGAVRAVVGEVVQPARDMEAADPEGVPVSVRALLGASGLSLLDWCADLLAAEPASVLAAGMPGTGPFSLFLEFADGRCVQLTCWRGPRMRRAVRLRVVAERGSATVELPRRVQWSDADGWQVHVVRRQQPLGEVLLERFHQTVTEGLRAQPSLADAHRVLGWLRAAVCSREEGRCVPLGE
jgi:predicted dehydrogenase